MKKELLPTTFPGISDEVYAGFWIRTAAKLLDLIILLPVIGLILYLNGVSKTAYFVVIIPNMLFYIWFEIFLVKQYGGTPGKLIMGIKIVTKNGDNVDWHNAVLRYLLYFCLSILGIIVTIWTLNMIDNETYTSFGFFKRNQFLATLTPIAHKINMWLSEIWLLSGIIVLLSNKRKRTVHDFIAGTVVVKSIFLEKIREITQPVSPEAEEL